MKAFRRSVIRQMKKEREGERKRGEGRGRGNSARIKETRVLC